MMRSLFLWAVAIVAVCCSSGEEKILFPVTDIVLRSPQQVEERLGEPDSVYTIRIMGKPIYCQRYNQYNVEVQFVQGQASDIVMHGPHGLSFDQTALNQLGIEEKIHPSDYKKGRYIRWTDTKQFSAISFYNPEIDSLGRIINFSVFLKARSQEKLVN